MTNETLRMQMLSGVITEGQYKAKLQENLFSKLINKILGIEEDEDEIEDLPRKSEYDNLTDEQAKKAYTELAKAKNDLGDTHGDFDASAWVSGYSYAMDVLKAKYPHINFSAKNESLNESMIGGIVGIGAINQIPPRAKADYELAFEHFLGERYDYSKFDNPNQDPYTMNEADEAAAVGEKVEAAVEKAPSVKDALNKLSDEEKDQLRAKLTKAGITADSRIEDVAGELDESLTEAEGDTKTKVANALSVVGGGIMKSMIVPLIPLIVGHTTGTGFGGGLAITAGVAGALIALAKLLGGGESMEEGKEVEEPSLYEGEVNENVGSTIDKMLQTFEFSEKGNDEMIEFANYLLSPEGPKNIARSIKGKLKGEGGENYFTSKPEELDAFLSKL
jgi:hypothetical protein